MKKIITKISLLPLLTFFTKKKTVRRTSDIEIPMPPKNLKPIDPPISLKWEKASEESKEEIKGYKAERSDRSPRYVPSRMSHDQLLSYTQNILANIQGSPYYTVPEISLTELQALMSDFEIAQYEYTQNKTHIALDYLTKARNAVIKCLTFLKVKYNVK